MPTSRKTDFRSKDIAKNSFSGVDISQGLELEPPSLSPSFLSQGRTETKDSNIFKSSQSNVGYRTMKSQLVC